MFGITKSTRHDDREWHARAGDLLGDNYNMPGIILCALGIVAMGCAIVAAGYGFTGWTALGALCAAALWIAGGGILLVEHRREKAIELRHGRRGHAPGHLQPVRYSAAPRRR